MSPASTLTLICLYWRYGLSAILGLVADEDDDANAAEKSTPIDEGLLLEFQTKIDAAKSGEDLEKIRKEMIRLSESMKKVLRPRYVKKMESLLLNQKYTGMTIQTCI